jgi:hypothetical protein
LTDRPGHFPEFPEILFEIREAFEYMLLEFIIWT